MSARTFVAVVLLVLAIAGEAARGPRSHRKALRAPPPADGKAISIEGRRSGSVNTKTINGRPCVGQYVTAWDNMCNSTSHPEGHVCANASKDTYESEHYSDTYESEHYCSYDVGPTACATCNDWNNVGPKCLKPDLTISQGLCSGRTWSTSSCLPESLSGVSVDWYGPQLAKLAGKVQTAEECATWTKNFCNFVGGTVKTDACAPGGPYCDTMDNWYHACHSDADCAGASNGMTIRYCCHSEAPKLESWSAKLCDGANVKGQALVDKMQQDLENDSGFQCHMTDCAAISEGSRSSGLTRVRWSKMQLLVLMSVASIAFSALN